MEEMKMRIKKMIRIILTMLLLSVFAVIIYAFNPPNGNEIVVCTLQKIHESGEDKFIYVLINKKGQYFLVSEEEMKSVVKSVMEAKEYYSHSKNKPQGRIVNPFDMYILIRNVEKINPKSKRNQYEEFILGEDGGKFWGHFVFSVCENYDEMDEIQKKSGVVIYDISVLHDIGYVSYLNDEYAIKVLNKILKKWPIDGDESYVKRTQDLKYIQ